ncbi:hypothetical protein BCR44DRAFT_1439532 [Catenaria anguillulae PL171]|uniref:Uncharacterized protein n=1 Tax=Catenaria anguillulae PL171 TaxID=765915 RepID=A0A1Y2HGD4_9FUNG|nr:hypothetical protein BCR44DRAFT_1439532 [Catenaria anguillulae PL171]
MVVDPRLACALDSVDHARLSALMNVPWASRSYLVHLATSTRPSSFHLALGSLSLVHSFVVIFILIHPRCRILPLDHGALPVCLFLWRRRTQGVWLLVLDCV